MERLAHLCHIARASLVQVKDEEKEEEDKKNEGEE